MDRPAGTQGDRPLPRCLQVTHAPHGPHTCQGDSAPSAPPHPHWFCLPGPQFLCFSSLTSAPTSHLGSGTSFPDPQSPAGSYVTQA